MDWFVDDNSDWRALLKEYPYEKIQGILIKKDKLKDLESLERLLQKAIWIKGKRGIKAWDLALALIKKNGGKVHYQGYSFEYTQNEYGIGISTGSYEEPEETSIKYIDDLANDFGKRVSDLWKYANDWDDRVRKIRTIIVELLRAKIAKEYDPYRHKHIYNLHLYKIKLLDSEYWFEFDHNSASGGLKWIQAPDIHEMKI